MQKFLCKCYLILEIHENFALRKFRAIWYFSTNLSSLASSAVKEALSLWSQSQIFHLYLTMLLAVRGCGNI